MLPRLLFATCVIATHARRKPSAGGHGAQLVDWLHQKRDERFPCRVGQPPPACATGIASGDGNSTNSTNSSTAAGTSPCVQEPVADANAICRNLEIHPSVPRAYAQLVCSSCWAHPCIFAELDRWKSAPPNMTVAPRNAHRPSPARTAATAVPPGGGGDGEPFSHVYVVHWSKRPARRGMMADRLAAAGVGDPSRSSARISFVDAFDGVDLSGATLRCVIAMKGDARLAKLKVGKRKLFSIEPGDRRVRPYASVNLKVGGYLSMREAERSRA